jgi:hypothetical protein
MIVPVNGSRYAIQTLGGGRDAVDGHYSDDWHLVLRDGEPLRKFPSQSSAIEYIEKQIRAERARNIGD